MQAFFYTVRFNAGLLSKQGHTKQMGTPPQDMQDDTHMHFEGGVMGSCRGTSGLGAKHLNEDGTTIIKSDITAMARCEIKLIHLQLHYLVHLQLY